MKKIRNLFWAMALLLFIQLGSSMEVFAADGNLAIAVSSSDVSVGSTVTVTIWPTGPNGQKATSDMEFTYNASVFSFVSCDTAGYGGGEGGKVTASGSRVNVTLKAISEGSCGLKVTGTNGKLRERRRCQIF